ncbi:MAG: sodium-dependent transporter [Marinobacter sp.]|uniref:sodium-dependent transporter n=1 Tax=Marinobacter sp. TaxID=50741 RepID=UPI0034A03226
MPTPYNTVIGSWTRRSTFFWAATGATVGLSNLWKFPYLASANGGGWFVLMYIACLLLVTLPLMLTETALGRSARHGLVLSLDGLIRSTQASRCWMWAGRFSILSGFLVLSFTAVIGGICLAYVFFGALGFFVGASDAEISLILSDLVENPSQYRDFMAWHVLFLVLVIVVSMQGVTDGLERAFRVIMPTFFMLLLALLVYSYFYGELSLAADHMLGLRSGQLSWNSLQMALAHAFYTLGLGMGVWVVFGSYMPSDAPLKRSVIAVVLMDTLIAIMAGLVIYALVFQGGADETGQGFGLVFLALPGSLSNVLFGQFVATVMFVAVLLVAWTSTLALLEPVIGWFQEWIGAPRGWSAFLMGVLAWLAGLGTLYSFNIWSDLTWAGGTIFRWVELLASGLLIPLVSIAIALFVGWQLGRANALSLIGKTPALLSAVWFWVIRLILPLVIVYIGASYGVSSFRAMCEENKTAFWCGSSERGSSDSSLDKDAPPAMPSLEPIIPGLPQPPVPVPLVPDLPPLSPQMDRNGDRGETEPGDELLYHSV